MDEPLAALIGAGAALLGVLGAGVVQLATTKLLIRSERQKLHAEAAIRATEVRMGHLLEVLSEMLALTDTEAHARFEYARLLVLIARAQLLIDRRVPLEKELNGALNHLLFSVQAHVSAVQNAPDRRLSADEEEAYRREILQRNAAVSECGTLALRHARESVSNLSPAEESP